MRLIVLVGFVLASSSACTSNARVGSAGESTANTGTVGMQLQVAAGVSLDSISYEIDSPTLLPGNLTGVVDISRSQAIQFLVGGLAPGDDYTIALSAMTDDGLACESAATPFSIRAGETTGVSVALVCSPASSSTGFADSGAVLVGATVTLADSGAPCPVVTSLSALPSEVDVGASVQVSASVSAADAVLTWSTTGADGSLVGASGPSSAFTCSEAGLATVTVTAIEPGTSCDNQASVVVTCDAPASVVDASALDAATVDGASAADGAACSSDRGLGGIGAPAETIVTASSSWNSTPAGTVDGTVTVGWNAGSNSGSLELAFPAPIAIDGIALAAVSLPTTIETYTITGLQGGTPVPLGSFADTVVTGFADELPPMMFAAGSYDGLRIDIQGNASWVSINELSLLTSDCPAGPGGLYDLSTGALVDAGSTAVDAGSQSDGSSEGSSETASDVAAPEAGACPSGAIATAPFPNFGTLTLSGTVGVPGTTIEGPLPSDCVSLVTSPTSGSLTFAFTPKGCSFNYVDSSGQTYTTNTLTNQIDSTTYSCGGTFDDDPDAFAVCPELAPHENGRVASVSLTVNQSTGAVSLSRHCTLGGPSCLGSVLLGSPSTAFSLSGSLSCSPGAIGVIACGASTCSAPSEACCGYAMQSLSGCVAQGSACPFMPLGGQGQYSTCSGPGSCLPGFVCCPPPAPSQASSNGNLPGSICQAKACPSAD